MFFDSLDFLGHNVIYVHYFFLIMGMQTFRVIYRNRRRYLKILRIKILSFKPSKRYFFLLKYFLFNILNKLNFLENLVYLKYLCFLNNIFLNLLVYNNSIYIYISIIFIQLFLLTLTIWTRACGPRVRIDQISYLTWKEFLINLFFIIIFLFLIFKLL